MRRTMQFVIQYDDDTLRGLSVLFHQEDLGETMLRAYVKDLLERLCQRLTRLGRKAREQDAR